MTRRAGAVGPLPRGRVLELFRAGDAALLSSSWENFPHSVVEALAVGTPVIATRTGGVAEVVRDGENGLVVEPGDLEALAGTIARFFADADLAARLRENAAASVADYAVARGITFVNHTFTSHLALSASLQPYAGLRDHELCEFPFAPKPLALEFTANHFARDSQGYISLSDAPGLGIQIDASPARKYLVDVEIKAKGTQLFSTSDKF